MTDNCVSQSRIFGTAWLLSICELAKSQSRTLGQNLRLGGSGGIRASVTYIIKASTCRTAFYRELSPRLGR